MEVTIAGGYSFAALVIAFVFILKRFRHTTPRLRLPPSGPFALPFIGHLHLLTIPVHRSLTRIAARHGPLLLLYFGSRRVLLVTSPDIAEECFTTNDAVFANRPDIDTAKYLSYEFTTIGAAPYGTLWRNLRRLVTVELFTNARLAALAHIRAEQARSLVRQLVRVEGPVELKPKFWELLVNVIMRAVDGKVYYGEGATEGLAAGGRFDRVVSEVFRLGELANPEDFVPAVRWLGMKGHKTQLVAAQREMDELFQEMVDEQRRRREEEVEERGKTLLDVMLSLQETDPENYSDIIIKGVILILLTASTESTSRTMEMAMSRLLNNPEVLNKLRDEIDKHVGHDRLIVDSDLASLPYLDNVIKETLRLFPVAPLLIPHRSSSDCKIKGYDIPAGTFLFVNIFAINRDPKLWTEPLKFKPERFEVGEGEGEGKGYNYMPFGSGRRKCPGEPLATRVMGLTVGTLVQCFDWERVGGMDVDLNETGSFTIHKAVPLKALCKPREVMSKILYQL